MQNFVDQWGLSLKMHHLRPLLLLALIIGLSGCTVRFAYNQLDWIAPWYLRGYVSLDEQQRSLLEQRLATRLDWHCSTQLPRYAHWLRELETQLASGDVSLEGLHAHARQAEAFWLELVSHLPADASELLASASDDQVQELFDNLDERTAENRRDFVDKPAEALQRERAERMAQRLRRWFGRLNTAQQARLEAWSVGLAPFGEQWLDNRALWQAALRKAIEDLRQDPPALEAALEQLFVRPERDWSDEYRARVQFNRDQTLVLLVDLYRLSSQRQRQRLTERVGSLARDLERLACEPTELNSQA